MLHIPVDLYKTLGRSARILMRYTVTYFQSQVRHVCLKVGPNMLITIYLAFIDIFGKYRPGFCLCLANTTKLP